MFALRQSDDRVWVVCDQNDEVVYSGTLSQCEDWLDQQENLARTMHRRSVTWWRPLLQIAARALRLALPRMPRRRRALSTRAIRESSYRSAK